MRLLLLKAVIVVVAAGLYVASPFVAAWNIREAVKNNDAAYLAGKVDWVSVKTTLKPTVASLMLDAAPAEGQPQAQPGLWQRFKAYVGRGAVNRTIDSYMTPEGLPQLFQYGRTFREQVKGQVEEPAGMSVAERAFRLWQRLKRADFVTLTRFEMTLADKFEPDRIYDATLELRGATWVLTELRVFSEGLHGKPGSPGFQQAWNAARTLARPQ